jgi:sigma-B regulation protein RsbU (phosphoserine phosphatase)
MTFDNTFSLMPDDDFEDFFENSLNGYVTTNLKHEIVRVNSTFANWTGFTKEDLLGKRFADTLSIGGKIYYETHLGPLLRMQKYFDEVALELSGKNDERIPVMVNAMERRDQNDTPLFVRFTIFKAIDRRKYEQNLLHAKVVAETHLSKELTTSALREQFIAVLGHDLRNPLQAVIGGASVISKFGASEQDINIAKLMHRSALRMSELIDNIMDFARARLGTGIAVKLEQTDIKPTLDHIIDELRTAHPDRVITADIQFTEMIIVDKDRIAQLLSNLLANALVHGYPTTPVHVNSHVTNDDFKLSVTNNGKKIPEDSIPKLFHPFTREESAPSKNLL